MNLQRPVNALGATLALSLLAACGGGGTSTPSTSNLPAVAVPTPAPIASTAASSTPLVTAQLLGSAGFINKNAHTVYVFDADLAAPGTSTCAAGCAAVWPAIVVPANASVPAPFGVITRADGTSQLTYSGRPLYTYVADSVAGSTAGDGINSFGATWHVARPAAGSATPAPNASNPPASSY